MALTTCSVTTSVIAALDDLPNDVGGLTAAQLKAKFDEFGTNFVDWFNTTHLPEVDAHLAETVTNVFNVQTGYGAVGDGVADDTSELSAAVAAAYSVGGEVYFPCGTYFITANIPNWHDVRKSGPGSIKIGSQTIPIEPTKTDSYTFYVDGANGNDGNIGFGSGTLAFKTIQKAFSVIDKWRNYIGNITIDIAAGTYNETVSASRPAGDQTILNIRGKADGSNLPTVIIDGTGNPSLIGMNVHRYYIALLDNIKIQNFSSGIGLNLKYVPYANLNNVYFFNCHQGGYFAHSVVVLNSINADGNNIVGSTGLTAYRSFMSLTNSVVKNWKTYGAYWAVASGGHCDYNDLDNNFVGIASRHASAPTSIGCDFTNNTYGIYAEHMANVYVDWATTTFSGNTTNCEVRTTFSSAWNREHIIMGNYHLWVDGSGKLRIKSGFPSSDTDGTVVGTQT